MSHGLSDETVDKLRAVLKAFPTVNKAVLYGSRAKGNFKPGSDIDLTLYGENLSHDDLTRISTALDDLLLPYTIDLSIFAHLENKELTQHINRVGVVLYEG